MRITPHAAARTATRESDAGRYQRHRPEKTFLYQIVEAYYLAFTAHLAEQGRVLPTYVQREFEGYLMRPSGTWLPAGALRVLPRRTLGRL